jgi:hypothetical protein
VFPGLYEHDARLWRRTKPSSLEKLAFSMPGVGEVHLGAWEKIGVGRSNIPTKTR